MILLTPSAPRMYVTADRAFYAEWLPDGTIILRNRAWHIVGGGAARDPQAFGAWCEEYGVEMKPETRRKRE